MPRFFRLHGALFGWWGVPFRIAPLLAVNSIPSGLLLLWVKVRRDKSPRDHDAPYNPVIAVKSKRNNTLRTSIRNGSDRKTGKSRTVARSHRHTSSKNEFRFDAVVFDGDDTLWRTQHLYDTAKDKFEDLCKQLGVWDSKVRGRLDALDSDRVKLLGFTPARFPGSMVQTLKMYLSTHNLPLSRVAIGRARYIGRHVFRRKVSLQPGVRAVLRYLARRYRLILFTKGDKAIQLRRLRESDLAKYFHAIHVVTDKTPQTLRKLCRLEKLAPSRTLFVGDSLRSDVRPAIEMGATAAWIPSRSWRFERDKRPRSKRFIEMPNLRMLLQVL